MSIDAPHDAETSIRLGPADEGRLVSADEFEDADFEEPWTYEREAGRLVVMPPDGLGHQMAAEPWRDAFVLYKHRNPGVVRHVFTGAWVRPDRDHDRVGDLGVYLRDERPTGRGVQPVPDLVVEVVSPGKVNRHRDYVAKKAEYLAVGVREYVIVDRFDRRVTACTRAGDGWGDSVLTEADTYRSALMPGLEVRVGEVF